MCISLGKNSHIEIGRYEVSREQHLTFLSTHITSVQHYWIKSKSKIEANRGRWRVKTGHNGERDGKREMRGGVEETEVEMGEG